MRAALRVSTLVLLGCVAAPAVAPAATTVGSDLSRVPTRAAPCVGGSMRCWVAQTALPGRAATVPSAGVVVTWRVKTAPGATTAISLSQLRPTAGGDYTVVGTIGVGQLPGAGGVATFPVAASQHDLQAGDLLALRVAADAPPVLAADLPGAATAVWAGSAVNDVLPPPDATAADVELLFNADIEPDADGDGHGDETQDLCPEDATTQSHCAVDVRVTNAVDQLNVVPGAQGTNTLTVRNAGVYPARQVALRWGVLAGEPLALPTLVAVTGPCTPDIHVGNYAGQAFTQTSCDLGVLAPGESRTLTALVRFPQPAAGSPAAILRVTSLADVDVPRHAVSDAPANPAGAFWNVHVPDRQAPALTVRPAAQRIKDVLKRGLRLKLTAREAASGRVRARLIGPGRRKLTAGSATWRTKGAAAVSVTVKLSRSARAALGRAGAKVTFEVSVTGTDGAANAAKPLTIRVTVRR